MYKRRRPSFKRKGRPKAKRIRTTSGAVVTQSRVFIPRSLGNPMAYSETKYFDTERTVANIASISGGTWVATVGDPTTINCLFAPTQGTGFNNREGRKCWVKKIKIRGFITWGTGANLTAGEVGDIARIILVQDKQTNGVQATGDLVIQSGTASTDPTISEFQSPANFGRFKVLFDKTFRRPPLPITYDGTNIEASGYSTTFKIFKKFRKPVLVHFNATNGGTVADIVDNSWHFMVADWGGAQVNNCYYKCRVVFCE